MSFPVKARRGRRQPISILAGLIFLAGAGWLAIGPWIRPPLHPDISGHAIPLVDRPIIFAEANHFVPDSMGAILSAFLVVGLIVLLFLPHRFSWIAGGILATSVACAMTVLGNHPELMERLGDEQHERQNMAHYLESAVPGALTRPRNARAPGAVPAIRNAGEQLMGWQFLARGVCLTPLAGLALLLSTPGGLPRRLAVCGACLLLGALLGSPLVSRRLLAEYHWYRAIDQAARGDMARARGSLREAALLMPSLARLERTRLLMGRIDFIDKAPTYASAYYVAIQNEMANHFGRARAILLHEWIAAPDNFEIRRAIARTWTKQGIEIAHLERRHDIANEESDFDETLAQGKNASAAAMWRQAIQIDAPDSIAARLFVGAWKAEFTVSPPHRQPDELIDLPVVDRALHADVLALLGDAEFRAGRFDAARASYRQSMKAWMLPKTINYRAQRGLGGL